MGTRHHNKLFRINGASLDDNEICAFLLPVGFADALLTISDRLHWSRVWIDENGDEMVLTDSQKQTVEQGILGLTRMAEINVNTTVNNSTDGGGGCSCCSGGGGTTVIVDYPKPNDGITLPPVTTDTPDIDDGINPPEGFTDYSEYTTYKCKVATQIVDDFTDTVGNLQTLGGLLSVFSGAALITIFLSATTYNAVVAGVVAAGLSATGGLALLAAALVGMIALGAVGFDYFNDIFDDLQSRRNEFICGVFGAATTEEVKAVFYAEMDAAVVNLAVDDGIRDYLREIMVSIVDALMPTEIIIALFKQVENMGREDFDCSSCGSTGGFTYTYPADEEGWVISSRVSYDGAGQALNHHPKQGNPPDPTSQKLQRTTLNVDTGLGANDASKLKAMSLEIKSGPLGDFFGLGRYLQVVVTYIDDTTWTSPDITSLGVWDISGFDISKELKDTAGGAHCIEIRAFSNGSSSNGDILVDNISVNTSSI